MEATAVQVNINKDESGLYIKHTVRTAQ